MMHVATSNNERDARTSREQTVEALIARGFPYSRKLRGHTSCVNYLAFSSGDGRWLASAGDDLHVRLFDFHEEDVMAPSCSFVGPRLNIFSLCFSANNRYLYCGATDNTIYKYDLSELSELTGSDVRGSPCEVFRGHGDSIRDITCHPWQDEVSMSASEDGRIILRDGRASSTLSRAEGTLQIDAEFTGVRWNPHMEHVFATSDGRGRVCLHDTRTTFGPRSGRDSKPIHQFVTTLSRPTVSHLSNPEISSIVWDRDGNKLAVTMLNYFPTIFSLSDRWPLAVCSAISLPDLSPVPQGQSTYINTCTIKHGSFGGPATTRDSYYAAGSDDFRGYVWEIPDLACLAETRRQMDMHSWISENPQTVGFAQKLEGPRYIPADLSRPLYCLNGHQSIVNSVLFHPTLLHVVTAGIERHIILHSATPSSPCTQDLRLTPAEVRMLPESSPDGRNRVVDALATGRSYLEEDDDSETIALFDDIIRKEGGYVDPFIVRRHQGEEPEDEEADFDTDMGLV